MLKRFHPDMYEPSVYDINYMALSGMGIKALLFDLDNTVAPYETPVPDGKTAELFAMLRGMGFAVCLLSNNGVKRVERFNESLGLYAVPKAGKPGKKGALGALWMMGATAGEAAVIGDQFFTDIWCGKRLGAYTVLVNPISDRDVLSVRFKRPLEKLLFGGYLKKQRMLKGKA